MACKKHREGQGLRKTLGVPSPSSTACGNVGSSGFSLRAFDESVSFPAGWARMLDYIVAIAISALSVPQYLAVVWPVLKTFPYNALGGIVVILALVVVNVVGIKEAARVNIVLAVLDIATQLLVMVLGVFLRLQPKVLLDQIQWGRYPLGSNACTASPSGRSPT